VTSRRVSDRDPPDAVVPHPVTTALILEYRLLASGGQTGATLLLKVIGLESLSKATSFCIVLGL